MDESQIQKIIETHQDPLKSFLGLDDWRITYSTDRLSGKSWMICDLEDSIYQRAHISVDTGFGDSDQDVLDGLFHEHAHILHGSFHNYRLAAFQMVAKELEPIRDAEQQIWKQAAEAFVLRMEWLWRNHLRALYLEQFTRPEAS